jgi:hypothetical protein
MAGRRGYYSNIIVYDERNRYYYLWAQKNKPLLDDEIRNMGIGLLDQIRRGIQNIYGEITSPLFDYSGFFSTKESFKVVQATDNVNNFVVKGGVSLDRPAVLYVKGFYIFFTQDVEYKYQMYPSDNIDLYTETDKSKTLTPIPSITTPSTDRIDIVYISLHFKEVTAVAGTDSDVYLDSNLKNPIVGTETANRLRAVVDIRVRENWTSTIDKNIFNHSEFLGSLNSNDGLPTDNVYNVPIAVIYRTAHSDIITNDQIVDLLSLYNKRAFSLEELSYRLTHGGYTEDNLKDKNLSGFTPQFPGGKIDESAFATGLNLGLGPEAFNSNSVTPRILDNSGKFFMAGLMIGHETGLVTYETGPEDLSEGELIAKNISSRNIMIGYGETGIQGGRSYANTLDIVDRGKENKKIISITNYDGETGSIIFNADSFYGVTGTNFVNIDYKGRVGINTKEPGWEQPAEEFNTNRYNDNLYGETGVNIVLDVKGSVQVRDHLFVQKDTYVERDVFGKTFKLPEYVSRETPVLIGFTGIPQDSGITGSVAFVMVKRGVALYGETGLEAYGYTGGQVAYEAYDAEGNRLFTIGDFGYDYDRKVKTLYGIGLLTAFMSDISLLSLPSPYNTSLFIGDTVSYSIRLEDNTLITGSLVLTADGWDGILQIKNHILNNILFPADPAQGYTGVNYSRIYQYEYYNTDGTITTETGISYGVQVIEDPFGYTGIYNDNHGRIILKDLVEGESPIKLKSIESFVISRSSYPDLNVPFIKIHYYGSGGYGGDVLNVKFAKLDLGEGAEGWLFNGDVYFNGNGLLNRVTFSPDVVFRDDIFVYGTIYAEKQVFNIANIQVLSVKNNLNCEKKGYFKEGISLGDDANVIYETLRNNDSDLNLYLKGKGIANELILRGRDPSKYIPGNLKFINIKDNKVSGYIGGDPQEKDFGIHLIDDRNVQESEKFKDLVIDFSDGRGNYSDVKLKIKGNVEVNNNFKTDSLTIGNVESNTDYKLQVEGKALINDILEVKALRYIGSEYPEGTQDVSDPVNITIIGKINNLENGEEYQNNQIILREKKFTSTKRIQIINDNKLKFNFSKYTVTKYYENGIAEYYKNNSDPNSLFCKWAMDNVSYPEDIFNEITSNDEIIVDNITIEKYKKYRCERIRLASIGTLNIEWSGYFYDPVNVIPSSDCIQKYYFTSPYFRNREGGTIIDWYPEDNRFGDDNFTVHVEATIIDTNPKAPTIYTINKSLGIYIPKSKWLQYAPREYDSNKYKSFSIFYPYENVIENFNSIPFEIQYAGEEAFMAGWKLVIYPRLLRQRRIPIGEHLEKLYVGEWSLDLCIVPENIGKIANLIGKLYISYYQS